MQRRQRTVYVGFCMLRVAWEHGVVQHAKQQEQACQNIECGLPRVEAVVTIEHLHIAHHHHQHALAHNHSQLACQFFHAHKGGQMIVACHLTIEAVNGHVMNGSQPGYQQQHGNGVTGRGHQERQRSERQGQKNFGDVYPRREVLGTYHVGLPPELADPGNVKQGHTAEGGTTRQSHLPQHNERQKHHHDIGYPLCKIQSG